MEINKLIEIMETAQKLKENTRHCFMNSGRQESVAEHSWRLSLMAYFVKDEFPNADINKIILMCIIHDLGEAFTGDIPAFNKSEHQADTESRILDSWLAALPSPYNNELSALTQEMNELKSTEAKIYKALDNMEAVLQHNESPLSTWLPLEYSYNITYGEENVSFSEYMKNLKRKLNSDTKKKISGEKYL